MEVPPIKSETRNLLLRRVRGTLQKPQLRSAPKTAKAEPSSGQGSGCEVKAPGKTDGGANTIKSEAAATGEYNRRRVLRQTEAADQPEYSAPLQQTQTDLARHDAASNGGTVNQPGSNVQVKATARTERAGAHGQNQDWGISGATKRGVQAQTIKPGQPQAQQAGTGKEEASQPQSNPAGNKGGLLWLAADKPGTQGQSGGIGAPHPTSGVTPGTNTDAGKQAAALVDKHTARGDPANGIPSITGIKGLAQDLKQIPEGRDRNAAIVATLGHLGASDQSRLKAELGLPDSYNKSTYDAFMQNTAVGRIVGSTAEGAAEGWGDSRLGLGPKTEEFLKNHNIFDNPDHPFSVGHAFNEAVIRGGALVGDIALRGLRGAYYAVADGVAQAAGELGGNQGAAKRDLRSLPDAFAGSAAGVAGKVTKPGQVAENVAQTAKYGAGKAAEFAENESGMVKLPGGGKLGEAANAAEKAREAAVRSAAGSARGEAMKPYRFDPAETAAVEAKITDAAAKAGDKAYTDAVAQGLTREQVNAAVNKAAKDAAKKVAQDEAMRSAREAAERAVQNKTAFDPAKLDAATQTQLADYAAGRTGGTARRLAGELSGKSEAEFQRIMTEEVNQGRATMKSANISGPPAQRMDIYEFADGTVVRYKPQGDTRRAGPTYSIEVKKSPALPDTGPGSAAFKVDAKGKPVPRGPEDLFNPFKDVDQGREFRNTMMDLGHFQLVP